jgi:FkbM family methyltransferase
MSSRSVLKQFAKAWLPEPVASALRRYSCRHSFYSYQPRLTTKRFGDYDFTVELVDPLGEAWYGHDWQMPPEIPLLQLSRLRPGAIVFDLGAHQCVMAMLLSKTVGPDGFVLAVEGGTQNSRAGKRNIELNSIRNCEVIHAVVSATSGRVKCDALGNGRVISTGHPERAMATEIVEALSVDDLAAAHGTPDVVYVDVEGCECDVLDGATRTFATRPDWFVEVHQGAGLEDHGGSLARVLSYFEKDYKCYFARETPENDYSYWNQFEPVQKSTLPSGRFFLLAAAQPLFR